MTLTRIFTAAAAATFLAIPAFAGDIMVDGAYVRASKMSGGAFMTIMNHGGSPDRLIAASTEVAEKTELHTHIADGNGVMKMVEVKEGFEIPSMGMHALARGGDHVMLMGLKKPLENGEEIKIKLTFQNAGEIEITVPVDNDRNAEGGHTMKMSN